MKKKSINLIIVFTIVLLIALLITNTMVPIKENFSTRSLENFDIVIIAGQSNAEGYGRRNEINENSFCAQPHNIDAPSQSVKHYQNNGDIENALHPICHLTGWDERRRREPRYTNRGGTNLSDCNPVGFGIDFGKEYFNNYNKTNGRKVLLVGCAYGGTGFFDAKSHIPFWWEKEDNSSYRFENGRIGTVRSLYQISKTKIAEVKNKVGPNSKVVALLWHQGESNASDDLSLYRSKIQQLFRDLRADIKRIFPNSPTNVPILMGGLSPDLYRNRVTRVENSSQAKLMSSFIRDTVVPSISSCKFVSAEPMSGFNRFLQGNSFMDSRGTIIGRNDNVHFSATSQREFGKRYFKVFKDNF